MGTLLPIFGWRTYATFRDDLRNEVNAWIRSTKEIDGCIDFDLALRGRTILLRSVKGSTVGIICIQAVRHTKQWLNVPIAF